MCEGDWVCLCLCLYSDCVLKCIYLRYNGRKKGVNCVLYSFYDAFTRLSCLLLCVHYTMDGEHNIFNGVWCLTSAPYCIYDALHLHMWCGVIVFAQLVSLFVCLRLFFGSLRFLDHVYSIESTVSLYLTAENQSLWITLIYHCFKQCFFSITRIDEKKTIIKWNVLDVIFRCRPSNIKHLIKDRWT